MRRALALAWMLASCGAGTELRQLETLGVHVQPRESGWFRLRSDEGYSFELPGVPLAEREEYRFAGAPVRTLFYDLHAEMSSRGFLLRAFDARIVAVATPQRNAPRATARSRQRARVRDTVRVAEGRE